MAFIADILVGAARREMKQRTDEILVSTRDLTKALDKNTRLMRKILGGNIEDKIQGELKKALEAVMEQEVILDKTFHLHIEAMKKFVESIP